MDDATEGGRVIFISSSATKKSTILPNYLMHAASKGAIEQCARSLAKDLGTQNITVNTVSVGPLDTDLFREGKTDHMIQFIRNIHMQKRLGVPEDVAPLVAFFGWP